MESNKTTTKYTHTRSEKKDYHKPELLVYGTLSDLVKAGTGAVVESAFDWEGS